MAEKLKQNQFEEKGVNPFNAPVPGESLTSAPSMQKGWERPPEHTEQQEAMESVYMELTSEDKLFDLKQYKWLLKRVLQKLGLSLSSLSIEFNAEEPVSSLNQFCKPVMSKIAKNLLFSNAIDFKYESQIRIANYNEWRKLLFKNSLLNSKIAQLYLDVLAPTLDYKVGDVI